MCKYILRNRDIFPSKDIQICGIIFFEENERISARINCSVVILHCRMI